MIQYFDKERRFVKTDLNTLKTLNSGKLGVFLNRQGDDVSVTLKVSS